MIDYIRAMSPCAIEIIDPAHMPLSVLDPLLKLDVPHDIFIGDAALGAGDDIRAMAMRLLVCTRSALPLPPRIATAPEIRASGGRKSSLRQTVLSFHLNRRGCLPSNISTNLFGIASQRSPPSGQSRNGVGARANFPARGAASPFKQRGTGFDRRNRGSVAFVKSRRRHDRVRRNA